MYHFGWNGKNLTHALSGGGTNKKFLKYYPNTCFHGLRNRAESSEALPLLESNHTYFIANFDIYFSDKHDWYLWQLSIKKPTLKQMRNKMFIYKCNDVAIICSCPKRGRFLLREANEKNGCMWEINLNSNWQFLTFSLP